MYHEKLKGAEGVTLRYGRITVTKRIFKHVQGRQRPGAVRARDEGRTLTRRVRVIAA